MVVVQCSIPGCTYETTDAETGVVIALLNLHALSHTQATHPPTPPQPKLDRPRIDIGVEEEVWNGFIRRWEAYKTGSGIVEATASMQLFQCASESLGDLILKADPDIQSKPVKEVRRIMQTFAVIPVAIGVRRAELMQLRQAPDELFRTFSARVKGKAETCLFTTSGSCTCGEAVQADYTTESVRDVLLAGIADIDIRREALSTRDMQNKSINDVIAFVESREMARNATPNSALSAISTFKRKQLPNVNKTPETNKPVPCPDCGTKFQMFKQRANGTLNTRPHTKCLNCWRTSRHKPGEENASLTSLPNDTVSQISVISVKNVPESELKNVPKSISLNHEVISKSDLRKTRRSEHPRAEFRVTLANSKRGNDQPEAMISGVVDSGAMSNLWGLQNFIECGFLESDLMRVNMDIRAANKNPINIVGAINAILEGRSPSGEIISTSCLIYISNSVNEFYLSFDSMLDLCIIDKAFPTIGAYSSCNKQIKNEPQSEKKEERHSVRAINAGCTDIKQGEFNCKCPQRESVPFKPSSLPFAPTSDNNEKMREWLLSRYGKSTFNTCPHRPLPCMTGPPMEIHIEENVKPATCHTAADIPWHFKEQVHSDLLRDEALGVIESVPYGEPVTWCHRMVVTRKNNGKPRRTVDLSPLNKFCKRETFASESPFQLARRIPGNTWKTVTDAWNGYHSVPLRESDRHLTTFITPFGRWRYTRAPQGFLSSGDGYNRRFDAILSEFERKERCVDDTVFHDGDLEEHWWRTINFLSTVGAAGIVLNPDKFQFAQRNVDFAGFLITENKILPLPKYIDAIRSFPTPTSTTDIRSWFGLINRVANYAQLRDSMTLFRPFLSPKYKFFWSDVLEKAFQSSKEIIIEAIHKGVEIFDITQPTCLRPDWSKKGIGYFLLQQHCKCTSGMPDCCPEGWKITLAGSRFLNGPEQRYAAIEGEALAIAWGLEQTKYFTQGCPNLLVVTDHKPLKKIFGDRTLDEISNSRLFRLKQRTLPWYFRIEYMPGTSNDFADAMSRYPSSYSNDETVEDISESMIATAICREMGELVAISWECLATETRKDQILSTLYNALTNDEDWTEIQSIEEYSKYFESLYISEGVILYKDRVVIPHSLRKAIMESLHAAHQGISSMELRAQSIVFWPGMTKDIQQTRAKCTDCNTNAPSQAQLPSNPASPPSTPFEKVFADFFDFGGHHYLVVGDRLSGWPEVYSTPTGSAHAGARGLIACLRSLFATFGVPEELSSDGGPEFTASQTQNFLAKWGVHHRKSSAYHPQSNGRAEVAVKSAKRLLRSNINPSGSLDNDKFLRGILQLRNTPDPDCKISPAEIVFGRPIRDAFSFINRLDKFSNKAIKPVWREAWSAKESALRTRFVKTSEKLNEHSRKLEKINIGDHCFVQNQTGNYPKRWDRTGVIVEVNPHDQYTVKIDGSGRLTVRNRRFLRRFQPATMEIQPAPTYLTETKYNHTQKEQFPPVNIGNETLIGPVDMHENPIEPMATQTPPPIHQPAESPKEVRKTLPAESSKEVSKKLPAALKRLFSHNNEGLHEDIIPSEEGGRKTRSRKT